MKKETKPIGAITFIIFFSFTFLVFSALAQSKIETIAERIKTHEPNYFQSIYAIETDSRGYVYLATNNGLFYYNGIEILKYNDTLFGNKQEYIKFYKNNNEIYAMPYNGNLIKLDFIRHKSFIEMNNNNKELKKLFCMLIKIKINISNS